MTESELLEQPRCTHVPGAQALAARLMGRERRQDKFTAGRALDQQALAARIHSQLARLASWEPRRACSTLKRGS